MIINNSLMNLSKSLRLHVYNIIICSEFWNLLIYMNRLLAVREFNPPESR
jgi:hypothetical protein